MPANFEPGITPPILIPGIIGGAAAGAAEQAQDAGEAVVNALTPDWLTKLGTYLTDRGTLIRIGTFAGGLLMCAVGVLALLKVPVASGVKDVVKVVK